jgi:hypothetical protein
MYLGRDADLSQWLGKAYFDWARPLDVTAMNPMQGMTSMLVTVNPYFNPASWVFDTDLPEVLKRVISLVIYFVEVTASSYALGVSLGFSRPFSFVASLWVAFLLFPPFNFVFGLGGLLGTFPVYGHTLGLSNLLLIAFIHIGAEYQAGWTWVRRLTVNWLLATAILLLVLLILLISPFYNGGLLIGTLLLTGVLFLASMSRKQLLWRLGAGVYVAAGCAALNFPAFFAGARAASARFSATAENALTFYTNPASLLCSAWGLFCDRFTNWPGALTGSHWLMVSIVLGAIAAAVRARPPLSRTAALFAALWAGLLIVWIGASFGIVRPPPLAPHYYFAMMYPFWAFFSLYAGFVLFDAIDSRIVEKKPLRDHVRVCGSVGIVAAAVLFLFHASPSHLINWGPLVGRTHTPITEYLQQEIALRPGGIYRGSVATLFGTPGSPLRQRLLESPEHLRQREFEKFLTYALENMGNSHDLLDLWWLDIPTLTEYGQGISKALMFYVSELLTMPGDVTDINFAFPRLANLDILRALGVRFVITDLVLPTDKAVLRRNVPLPDGIDLRLYELHAPNLGDFSPRKVSAALKRADLARRLAAEPALLESETFAEQAVRQELVPIERSQMRFERGGVHVTASSRGQSALLLPVQFSHCFRPTGEGSERVAVVRANAIHTLIVFVGELDIHLRWQYGFWRNSACRLRDAADMTALGLD